MLHQQRVNALYVLVHYEHSAIAFLPLPSFELRAIALFAFAFDTCGKSECGKTYSHLLQTKSSGPAASGSFRKLVTTVSSPPVGVPGACIESAEPITEVSDR